MKVLGRVAKSVLSTYVKSVLTPVERLARLAGREHLFDHAVSAYRERTIEDNGMIFDASHPRLIFRATHFAQQEPDLLRWIEERYAPGEIFFDVGANIGYFSMYAALKRNVRVYAFEPESLTFASLNRNIFYNHLSEKIIALPLALSDNEAVSVLNLKSFVPGNAYNTFGAAIDFRGQEFEAEFRQGSLGMTLDYFITEFHAPEPHHVKIDVDGNEAQIIVGMARTLAARSLKTLCVELTPRREEHAAIILKLAEHGFREDTSFVNSDRDGVGTRNYYFARS